MTSGKEAELHTASELHTGMSIEHNRFGRGTINNVDADNPQGARISVMFNADSVVRTLILKFAKFAIID